MNNPSANSTRNNNSNSNSASKAGSASCKTMAGKAAANDSSEGRKDVCQIVTDAIVKVLETGVKPWAKSWTEGKPGGLTMPLRHTGERYRSINVLILWAAQDAGGYESPFWMTYRQAGELGGQVRKGEKATTVFYYGTAAKNEAPAEGDKDGGFYRFLKSFSVFNCDQIDNLPERYRVKAAPVTPAADRIPELEAFVQGTAVPVRHGGNRAFYRPDADFVQMPGFEQFKGAEFYYSTLAHELAHATKHPKRLDRNLGCAAWGDEGYAKEELVAELASAFIGAEFGFAPEHIEDHAAYLACWLKALKDDKRLIFSMAAKAQAAVDYLMNAQSVEQIAEAA